MPEYLAPGVYVEEIERGPKPIEGVATSTAAFLGETERGSTLPQFVESYNTYLKLFGTVFDEKKYIPLAINSFFENGGRRCVVCRIVGKGSQAASNDFGSGLTVSAVGPGEWGTRVLVKLTGSTAGTNDWSTDPPTKKPSGFRFQIAYSQEPVDPSWDPFDGKSTDPKVRFPKPLFVEDFDDIILEDETSPDHYSKRIKGNSNLISVSYDKSVAGTPGRPSIADTKQLLSGGVDATSPPSNVEYTGDDPEPAKRTGLSALLLDPYREVALVYAPDTYTDAAITEAVISHCENQRFRFAVLDAPGNQGKPDSQLLDPRSRRTSKYAAFYYPWITISDPKTGQKRNIPPGGAVLGIYARSDNERGVFKAPANETVRGALDLEYMIDERTQELLNPRSVNVIRKFPARGILLWGARTISDNTLWKYVSVRRLFIFLEHSIYDGTQWVVFEPNDERLWARVTDTIRLFLRTQWRNGALMGTTEAEAFQIACGRNTMTQDDILNGRLICEIGVAPVRPAEFVIFRIFQMTSEAQT
jgi:phage tail sheath protein FI